MRENACIELSVFRSFSLSRRLCSLETLTKHRRNSLASTSRMRIGEIQKKNQRTQTRHEVFHLCIINLNIDPCLFSFVNSAFVDLFFFVFDSDTVHTIHFASFRFFSLLLLLSSALCTSSRDVYVVLSKKKTPQTK